VVARLNSDGSLDRSFGTNGVFVWDAYSPPRGNVVPFEEGVTSLAVLSNGNILAGGWGQSKKGSSLAALELTPSGSLVSNFGSRGLALPLNVPLTGTDYVHAMAVVPTTGQIVLAANAGSAVLVVLTSAGKLDTSFNGTGYESYAGAGVFNGVAVQKESSTLYEIVASGSGSSSSVVGRYFLYGAVDTAFGGAGTGFYTFGSGLTSNTLELEADGSIILGGSQSYDSNGDTEMMVGHISAGGVLDTSFGPNGTGFSFAMIGVNSSINSLPSTPATGASWPAG
jgi:uncharacterized delta-60 repeat protein